MTKSDLQKAPLWPWSRYGKPELREAVELLEVYAKPGWVPDHKLFAAVSTVVKHFAMLKIGIRKHTYWNKSIVYFVELNGSRVSGDFADRDEAENEARKLIDTLGFVTWSDMSETMD